MVLREVAPQGGQHGGLFDFPIGEQSSYFVCAEQMDADVFCGFLVGRGQSAHTCGHEAVAEVVRAGRIG